MPSRGTNCRRCGGNDHFARVCLENPLPGQGRPSSHQVYNRSRAQPSNICSSVSGPSHRRRQPAHAAQSRRTSGQYVHEVLGSELPLASGVLTQPYFREEDESQTFQTYNLDSSVPAPGKRFFANLLLLHGDRCATVKFQIDLGATCSIIADDMLFQIFPNITLSKSRVLLRPYGPGKPLHLVGRVTLTCERDNCFKDITLQVLPASVMAGKAPLLSGEDSIKMNLLSVRPDEVYALQPQEVTSVAGLPAVGNLTKDCLLSVYSEVFEGLGCLQPPVSFTVNDYVTHSDANSSQASC